MNKFIKIRFFVPIYWYKFVTKRVKSLDCGKIYILGMFWLILKHSCLILKQYVMKRYRGRILSSLRFNSIVNLSVNCQKAKITIKRQSYLSRRQRWLWQVKHNCQMATLSVKKAKITVTSNDNHDNLASSIYSNFPDFWPCQK